MSGCDAVGVVDSFAASGNPPTIHGLNDHERSMGGGVRPANACGGGACGGGGAPSCGGLACGGVCGSGTPISGTPSSMGNGMMMYALPAAPPAADGGGAAAPPPPPMPPSSSAGPSCTGAQAASNATFTRNSIAKQLSVLFDEDAASAVPAVPAEQPPIGPALVPSPAAADEVDVLGASGAADRLADRLAAVCCSPPRHHHSEPSRAPVQTPW